MFSSWVGALQFFGFLLAPCLSSSFKLDLLLRLAYFYGLQAKFQSFFGPGVIAEIGKCHNAHWCQNS